MKASKAKKSKKLKIVVTQEMIDTATPAQPAQCMVAKALRAAGFQSINVNAVRFKANKDETRYMGDLPIHVSERISQFDKDKSKVKPFYFSVDLGSLPSKPVQRKAPGTYTPRGKTKKKSLKGRVDKAKKVCKRRYHADKSISIGA